VLGLQLSRIIPRCITQVSYISYVSMRTNKVIPLEMKNERMAGKRKSWWWREEKRNLCRVLPSLVVHNADVSTHNTCFYSYHLFVIYKIRVTGEIRGRAQHLCQYNVYGSASGFVYNFALIIVHSWHSSLQEPYWTLPMCLNIFYGLTRPRSECWLFGITKP